MAHAENDERLTIGADSDLRTSAGASIKSVTENRCGQEERPEIARACVGASAGCQEFTWFVGPWSNVSSIC